MSLGAPDLPNLLVPCCWGRATSQCARAADATVLRSRSRQAFAAQRRADASAAPTSAAAAAAAAAAGWVLYWSSLVTAIGELLRFEFRDGAVTHRIVVTGVDDRLADEGLPGNRPDGADRDRHDDPVTGGCRLPSPVHRRERAGVGDGPQGDQKT
jgi:hypothetical protein